MTKSSPTLADVLRSFRAGDITYDELKATIVGWKFDRLPFPLWYDHADRVPYGFADVPGTWEEFIRLYDDGTPSHDEWWGIAGKHPDWAGAPHEKPEGCDAIGEYIVGLREPVETEKGLLLTVGRESNLYLTEYHPPHPPVERNPE